MDMEQDLRRFPGSCPSVRRPARGRAGWFCVRTLSGV